jgi:L-threonylcarbamoyladenylate synthase
MTEKISPSDPDPAAILRIADCIQAGGIVAIPTDTCYGLATDPFNAASVQRLFTLKGRDPSKPILLLISRREMLHPLVSEILPLAEQMMAGYWPGPLTLIFKSSDVVSKVLTGGTDTIAIRLPDSPFLSRLIEAIGFPITATSANRSGDPNPTSAQEVEAALGPSLDMIIDGGPCSNISSTVLDVTTRQPRIIREGGLRLPPITGLP